MLFGYARVSTRKQSLNSQIDALHKAGVRDVTDHKQTIFKEKYTGSTTQRPQFKALINAVRKGDTVYLVRLDRFARNLREALNALHDLKVQGVTVKVLQPYPVTLNDKNTLVIDNLLMFAEMERRAILNRTRIGKRYAIKRKGRAALGGRPLKDRTHYKAIYDYYSKPGHNAKQTAKVFGCSVRTVYNWVKRFRDVRKLNP